MENKLNIILYYTRAIFKNQYRPTSAQICQIYTKKI